MRNGESPGADPGVACFTLLIEGKLVYTGRRIQMGAIVEEHFSSASRLGSLNSPGRSSSLRLKLMVYFLVILLIPLISLGFVGPALYARSIERETNSHMAGMISQVNMNIELRVREMEQPSTSSRVPRSVSSFLMKGYATISEHQAIAETLASISATHPKIAGVLVVAENDAWQSDGFSRTTRDPLTEEQWYAIARDAPGMSGSFPGQSDAIYARRGNTALTK